jgi:hypothetical protein
MKIDMKNRKNKTWSGCHLVDHLLRFCGPISSPT